MILISIVSPVYCNAGSLPELHERLAQVAARHPQHEFELLFVDDGSFDNSYTVLCEIAARDQRVRVIKLSRNFGSNVALLAGLSHARGNCVGIIAADLQDPPELLSEMITIWEQGTPMALAARRTRNDPLLSRLPAAVFNRAFRRYVFKDFPKDGFDFALIDRKVVDVLITCAEKNSHLFGLIMWTGFSYKLLSYDRAERRHGRSMWTFTKKVKYFIDAFTSFSYLPLRAASSLGFLLASLGLIYALIVVVARFMVGFEVEGWTSLMIVLLITSGAQLVMLGVIGEYIWRSLEQTRQRPLFVVEQIVETPAAHTPAHPYVGLLEGVAREP